MFFPLWRRVRLATAVAVLGLWCQACGQAGTGLSESATAGRESLSARGTVGVEATYSTQSDWGSGYVSQVVLTNKGTAKVTDWQLEFDLPANIDSAWNTRVVNKTGNHYVLGSQSYNNSLDAGQSVTIGWQGSPGLRGAVATNVVVTGEGGSAPSPTPAPSASASAAPSPSPSAPASAGQLTYSTDNEWGGGFTGKITLTNNGTAPITNWVIEADWNVTLTNVWNGEFTKTGNTFRFTPASYNRTVNPGQSISVGFQGTPGSGGGPTAMRLNGTTVPVASPTPTPVASPSASPRPSASPSPTNPTPSPSASPVAPSPTPTPTSSPSATGYFHTEGSKIVDASGKTVKITGVNWFGLETADYAPHGLWTRNLDDMVAQIAANGYNTMRVPYCNQMFDSGLPRPNVNYNANPELLNKTPLEILDALVASAGRHGVRIILDRHRPGSGGQSPLWYTSQYSEQRWINDWVMLANRYKNNPTVIGADLHNEPNGSASWGDGNQNTDWRLAAERCGNAILAANPNWLIVVEGIERVGNDYYWWGGNLAAAGQYPVRLNVPGRLVYSPHDYPQTVHNQSWFSAANYPNNLDAIWDSHWGYLVRQNIAPVMLGEFGTRYETTSDKQWLNRLAGYLGNLNASFTYWSWNPNSSDTGGILKDDWRTINTEKQAVIAPLQAPKL